MVGEKPESPNPVRRTVLKSASVGAVSLPGLDLLSTGSLATQSRIDVLAVNGTARDGQAFHIEGDTIDSVRLRIVDSAGEAVERQPPPTLRIATVWGEQDSFALTHQGDGTYRATNMGFGTVFTSFLQIAVRDGPQTVATTKVPINRPNDSLTAPVPDFAAVHDENQVVEVNGVTYYAVNLWNPTYEIQDGWLVFDEQGDLVTDSTLRRHAAFTAAIADRVDSDAISAEMLRNLAQTLRNALTATNIGEELVAAQNIAAELLGFYLTSGSGKISGTTLKQATKVVAREFADRYLDHLKEKIVQEVKAEVGIADIETTLKELSEREIAISAYQAESAATLLEQRDPDAVWTQQAAYTLWKQVQQARSDGYIYLKIRHELLPSGDPKSQFIRVSKNVVEGAGIPVDELVSLIVGGELGYLSETFKEVGRFRAQVQKESQEWKGRTAKAHQLTRSRYGEVSILKQRGTGLAGEPAAETGDEWPMGGGGLARTSAAPGATGPTPPIEEAWRFHTGDSASNPAVVDETVYVGSRDHNVYALDAATGELAWDQPFQTGFPVWCDPAVADGTVYIGSNDHHVYALNAATGELVWNEPFQTGSYVTTCPAVEDGTVYVGSNDSKVYAIDAASGNLAWDQPFDTNHTVDSNPVVADGTVYIGSSDQYMYALDAASGELAWDQPFDMEGKVYGGAAIVNDVVYVGSGPGDSQMHALDAATGEKVWDESFQTEGEIHSSPAIKDSTIYFGTYSSVGKVYALDAKTGELVWDEPFETNGAVDDSPAVVDGTIYFGSTDNYVDALDTATGQPVWEKPFETSDSAGGPAVAGNTVYVGCLDGKVYALR